MADAITKGKLDRGNIGGLVALEPCASESEQQQQGKLEQREALGFEFEIVRVFGDELREGAFDVAKLVRAASMSGRCSLAIYDDVCRATMSTPSSTRATSC